MLLAITVVPTVSLYCRKVIPLRWVAKVEWIRWWLALTLRGTGLMQQRPTSSLWSWYFICFCIPSCLPVSVKRYSVCLWFRFILLCIIHLCKSNIQALGRSFFRPCRGVRRKAKHTTRLSFGIFHHSPLLFRRPISLSCNSFIIIIFRYSHNCQRVWTFCWLGV